MMQNHLRHQIGHSFVSQHQSHERWTRTAKGLILLRSNNCYRITIDATMNSKAIKSSPKYVIKSYKWKCTAASHSITIFPFCFAWPANEFTVASSVSKGYSRKKKEEEIYRLIHSLGYFTFPVHPMYGSQTALRVIQNKRNNTWKMTSLNWEFYFQYFEFAAFDQHVVDKCTYSQRIATIQ